jgi:hypothetical protein
MNRPILAIVITAAATTFVQLAHSQFDAESRYSPNQVSALVDRVHQDLNHAYGVRHFSEADRDRLNNAEKQLREFAQKWSKLKFDRAELDSAIGAMQHVLDENRLPAESRDALSDDMSRLRQMRDAYDHHDIK